MSVTKTLPAASTATPDGLKNRAAVPTASRLPDVPANPAKVADSAA
ncbi:MAG: hypothetical protein WDM76_18380 [Limisphaerales bacterium]